VEVWLIILGMTVVTYGARLSVIALLGDHRLPEGATRALRFVPPAVLAAIVFPALLRPEGTLDLSTGNGRLLAGIVAALVAWRSKNTILAIAVGMVLLWLLATPPV
jgi:branched-subunit amino acid transport protein